MSIFNAVTYFKMLNRDWPHPIGASFGLDHILPGGILLDHGGRNVILPGYIDEKAAVQKRLRRVEGQIRGIQRLVEEDQYCINILDQVSATTRALQAVAMKLLADHLSHCVMEAVSRGSTEVEAKVKEAQVAIARLVRS